MLQVFPGSEMKNENSLKILNCSGAGSTCHVRHPPRYRVGQSCFKEPVSVCARRHSKRNKSFVTRCHWCASLIPAPIHISDPGGFSHFSHFAPVVSNSVGPPLTKNQPCHKSRHSHSLAHSSENLDPVSLWVSADCHPLERPQTWHEMA